MEQPTGIVVRQRVAMIVSACVLRPRHTRQCSNDGAYTHFSVLSLTIMVRAPKNRIWSLDVEFTGRSRSVWARRHPSGDRCRRCKMSCTATIVVCGVCGSYSVIINFISQSDMKSTRDFRSGISMMVSVVGMRASDSQGRKELNKRKDSPILPLR